METFNFAEQEYKLPQNLHEARQALLTLPKIENFIKTTSTDEAEIDRGLETMIADVTKELDAQNMVDFISFCLGQSEEEKERFFAEPARQPFQSKVELSTETSERTQQFLTIGRYVLLKYQDIKNKKGIGDKDVINAGENLRMFYEYATLNLYANLDNQFYDKVNGIENRDTKAKAGSDMLTLYHDSASQIASEFDVDEETLYEEMLEVSEGGNFPAVFSYLLNHQGRTPLRRALEKLLETRNNDKSLITEKLQILWQIEAFRMTMGVDLELIYELNGMPNLAVVEDKLHKFLARGELVKEMEGHVKKEASPALSQSQSLDVPIDFWQMLEQRAKYHNFSDQAATPLELKRRNDKLLSELSELFPPRALENTPKSFIDAPVRIGAKLRRYDVTYHNQEDELVDVIILNPRDDEIISARSAGHEIGHRLHAYVISKAEKSGYVVSESWERVSSGVKEEFTQLIEEQVDKIFRRKKGKSEEKSGEWTDLWDAYIARRQAPYALTQAAVRVMLEEMWKAGKYDWVLSDREASVIIDELKPKISSWYSEGVRMNIPLHTILTNIELVDSLDGPNYLKKYIQEDVEKPEGKKEEPILSMKRAFEKRFGEIWIDNPEALAVLFALMAETGINQDITSYGKFVLEADISEVRRKLTSWGISENEI